MKKIFILFSSALIIVACVQVKKSLPLQDENLSFEKGAEDIVSRLTLEEEVLQMMEEAPGIPPLGIQAYNWWNETLHGVARSLDMVTVFPNLLLWLPISTGKR